MAIGDIRPRKKRFLKRFYVEVKTIPQVRNKACVCPELHA